MEERKVLKHPFEKKKKKKDQLIIFEFFIYLKKSLNAVRLQPPIYIGKHGGSPRSRNFIQVKHRIKLKIKI